MSSTNEPSANSSVTRGEPNGTPPEPRKLHEIASQAANGDEVAFDEFVSSVAPSAWGMAYSVTMHAQPAVTASSDGIRQTLMDASDSGESSDIYERLFVGTRTSGVQIGQSDNVTLDLKRESEIPVAESQDPQATVAFGKLEEPQRSALWLTGVEHLSDEQTGKILGLTADEVDEVAEEARNAFRKHYLDATRRDDLDPECAAALDRLGSYVDRSLDTEGVAATELHLVNCADCRSVVLRISDVSTRVRAAVPPTPSWLQSRVHDNWKNLAGSPIAGREGTAGAANTTGLAAAGAAGTAGILAGAAGAGAGAGLAGAADTAEAEASDTPTALGYGDNDDAINTTDRNTYANGATANGTSAKRSALTAVLASLALLAALVSGTLFWAKKHNDNLASDTTNSITSPAEQPSTSGGNALTTTPPGPEQQTSPPPPPNGPGQSTPPSPPSASSPSQTPATAPTPAPTSTPSANQGQSTSASTSASQAATPGRSSNGRSGSSSSRSAESATPASPNQTKSATSSGAGSQNSEATSGSAGTRAKSGEQSSSDSQLGRLVKVIVTTETITETITKTRVITRSVG